MITRQKPNTTRVGTLPLATSPVMLPRYATPLNIHAISLLGVHIHTVRLRDLLRVLEQSVLRRERRIIAYANTHALNLAQSLPWFRAFLNQSDLVFCDGFGVKWGARLVGHRLPQRMTPPDWLDQLAQLAAHRRFTLYLLGARPGIAERAASRLQERFPELQVVGAQHGYFDKTYGSSENEAVVAAINQAQPDLLLLGFGMPLQERWLLENWGKLNAKVALPVGAAFDYLSGALPRGPAWMTNNGLEWLARLAVEPRRLWRRYLIGNPLFLWRLLQQRFNQRHFE